MPPRQRAHLPSQRRASSIPEPTTTIPAALPPVSRLDTIPVLASVFNASVFGDVLVNDNASIVADAGDGINAYNYGIGDTVVNVGSGISIQALTAATSSSGKAPYGVSASNYGPGNVAITTSSGATITSGSSEITRSTCRRRSTRVRMRL